MDSEVKKPVPIRPAGSSWEVLSEGSLASGIKRWEEEKFQRQQVRTANGSVTSELGDLEQADSSCCPHATGLLYFSTLRVINAKNCSV